MSEKLSSDLIPCCKRPCPLRRAPAGGHQCREVHIPPAASLPGRVVRRPYKTIGAKIHSHQAIEDVLVDFEVDPRIQALVMDHVRNAKVCITTAHGLTEAIRTTQGVPQGSVLSPLLFNMCIHGILRRTLAGTSGGPSLDGVANSHTRLPALAYTDDVVLVGADLKELRCAVVAFTSAAKGLHMNAAKSAILMRTPPKASRAPKSQHLHWAVKKMDTAGTAVSTAIRQELKKTPIEVASGPLTLATDVRYLGIRIASNRLETQWDRAQESARRLVRSYSYSTAPLISGNWLNKHQAIQLARAASHGSLLYGSAAVGTVSLMADIDADRSMGHVLAWHTVGYKGFTHQSRTHHTAMVALGISPTVSLHVKARCTMVWGILQGKRDTPAFAVLMISIVHAILALPTDGSQAAQVPTLLALDAAASAESSGTAWTPAFLRMAAELRLLGYDDLVTQLVTYAKLWASASLEGRKDLQPPELPQLGNKETRLAQLPPTGKLPKTWDELPQLIEGATVSMRTDALTQLLWQASTYPHALYNSSMQLRSSRKVHVYQHDARARGMAWVQPVPTAVNAAQWATQDDPVHGRKALFNQNGRLLLSGCAEQLEDAQVTCPACAEDITAGKSAYHLMLDCSALDCSALDCSALQSE